MNSSDLFSIDIITEYVTQLRGAQIELSFDPQFISFDTCAVGSLLIQDIDTETEPIKLEQHDPENGILKLAIACEFCIRYFRIFFVKNRLFLIIDQKK